MFGSIGMPELVLIFVVALLVFGPKKLPEIGKSLGKGLAEFKRASDELKKTIETEIEQGKTEISAVKDHLSSVKDQVSSVKNSLLTPPSEATVPQQPADPASVALSEPAPAAAGAPPPIHPA